MIETCVHLRNVPRDVIYSVGDAACLALDVLSPRFSAAAELLKAWLGSSYVWQLVVHGHRAASAKLLASSQPACEQADDGGDGGGCE